jgi:hypothetical protein
MDDYSGIDEEDLGEADGALPAHLRGLEPVANHRSLVDMRCRPLIHWMSAVSAYRMDRGEI